MKFPPEVERARPQYQGKVARLNKAVYGLRQAGRTWYNRFTSWMIEKGYVQSPSDPCLFYNKARSVWVLIYVDDGHVACTNYEEYVSICEELERTFKIKRTGKVTYTLGMQLEWGKESVTLHQHTYTKDIIDKHSTTTKTCSTPATTGNIDLHRCNGEQLDSVDGTKYRAALGALMFLANCTRPDIATAVNRCARHMADPKRIHADALERIFQYLRKHPRRGVRYDRSGPMEISAYSDSNLGGDTGHERSRGGHVLMLANGPIYWRSKIHSSTSISSCESEYIELSETILTVRFMQSLLIELHIDIPAPTMIYVDNTSAIDIARNPQSSKRTRHIQLRYQATKEAIEERLVFLEHVPTEQNTADILTKPLQGDAYKVHANTLTSEHGGC